MAEEGGPQPTKRLKRQKNVLIGVTGSVASIKLSKLVDGLLLLDPKVLCKLTKPNGDLSDSFSLACLAGALSDFIASVYLYLKCSIL